MYKTLYLNVLLSYGSEESWPRRAVDDDEALLWFIDHDVYVKCVDKWCFRITHNRVNVNITSLINRFVERFTLIGLRKFKSCSLVYLSINFLLSWFNNVYFALMYIEIFPFHEIRGNISFFSVFKVLYKNTST